MRQQGDTGETVKSAALAKTSSNATTTPTSWWEARPYARLEPWELQPILRDALLAERSSAW